MTRLRVVLDTNVLISALIFPKSNPDHALRLVREGTLIQYASPFMIAELGHVLMSKFGYSREEKDERSRAVFSHARIILPLDEVEAVSNDADNRILECALACRADFLVTGDRKHLLPLQRYRGIDIVTVRELLAYMGI